MKPLQLGASIAFFLLANFLLFAIILFNERTVEQPIVHGNLTLESKTETFPRLHLLLHATHSTPEFCKTLLTTLLLDYSPVVINWGSQERDVEGRLAKIRGVHDYITTNVTSPEELIFMVDAFDVWMQHPPSTLLTKYLASSPRVLIGADKRCWPFSQECLNLPQSPLPAQIYGNETDSGTEDHQSTFHLNRPRYPNSGTILAPQSLLLPLYSSLLHESTTQSESFDDQKLVILAYSSQSTTSPHNPNDSDDAVIHVDFTSDLFQVMTMRGDDMIFMRGEMDLPNPLGKEEERVVWNRVTGMLPSVLHFNGGEKRLLGTWWERMWWVTGGEGSLEEREMVRRWVKSKVRKGGVTDAKDGRWMGWRELGCDTEAIWG